MRGESFEGRSAAQANGGESDGDSGVQASAARLRLAVLVAEGSDVSALRRLCETMERHDVATVLFAPDSGGPALSDGQPCTWVEALEDRGGVACDAIALILTALAADRLTADAQARDFLLEAYHAGKAIAHDSGAAVLLEACGIRGDDYVLPVEDVADLLVCLPRRCATRTPLVSRSV